MNAARTLPSPGSLAEHWSLFEDIVYLNHGSFGACPSEVMGYRDRLLGELSGDPMAFLLERHQPLLEELTTRLEKFTGAQPGSVVMVENATTGINTILKNLPLNPGDAVMVSDQEYFSSANALQVLAQNLGLSVIRVEIPWPAEPESVLEAFERAIEPGVRFALVDHAVSSSGIVLPLKEIVTLLDSYGIGTVVDGAHGPGQIPLQLEDLGCVAYTGNCHKWLCSPLSSAMLYVRPDFQDGFKPLAISHLPWEVDSDYSDYRLYFSWNGTPDPTPALSVPAAMDFMAGLVPGGWKQVMEANRNLALEARELICNALGTEPPCPESMVGSMASAVIPGPVPPTGRGLHWIDPLQRTLREEYGIVVPVTRIRDGSIRLVRISAQLYNSIDQFGYLADALSATMKG